MITLTAEQFKKKYGEAGVNSFAQQPKQEPTLGQRVGGVIQNAGEQAQQAIVGEGQYAGQNPITRGFEATASAFNAVPQVATQLLPKPARDVIGTVGDAIGSGFTALTNKIGDIPQLQDWVKNHSVAAKTLENILKTTEAGGQIAGTILGADQLAKGAQKAVDTTKQGAKKLGTMAQDSVITPLKGKVASSLETASPDIMNRVARLTPTEYNSFQKIAGKTPGEYLSETGNFGAPDKIISNEAVKFTNSLNQVDDALAQLPGTYKNGAVTDALDGLLQKAKATSGENTPSPIMSKVQELVAKNEGEGLTMSEINEVKRLYEREVKLGYSKLINPEGVAKATNIDSSLRSWQVKQASELGFKNIAEMNKQTQISKFIVNKLGQQIVGKSGLNSVNLTDWIMLSGGNPTSVAGFLTKKFFSSKSVQAKIAELLKQGETKGPVTPVMSAKLK